MATTLVPAFSPSRDLRDATHFYCPRHSCILPAPKYQPHNADEHGGRSPAVMWLIGRSDHVADVYDEDHPRRTAIAHA